MFLITSYRTATHAPTSSSSLYSIRQGNIQAPGAGTRWMIKDLSALINTNNPQGSSNFIITTDGVNSYGAAKFGFDTNWAKDNTNIVTLNQDIAQIRRLISRGVLPNNSNLSTASLKNRQLGLLFKHISNNFPKIMLYFTATSPTDGKIYKLYITDPCPGKTNWTMVIQGRLNPQTNIPAYTNVLSKWRVN
jgi:hypothetical protein